MFLWKMKFVGGDCYRTTLKQAKNRTFQELITLGFMMQFIAPKYGAKI